MGSSCPVSGWEAPSNPTVWAVDPDRPGGAVSQCLPSRGDRLVLVGAVSSRGLVQEGFVQLEAREVRGPP